MNDGTGDDSDVVWSRLTRTEMACFVSRAPGARNLVHYTNFGALRGILENEEFWFSSASTMNDFDEIIAGKDLLELFSSQGGALHGLMQAIAKRDQKLWSLSNDLYRQRRLSDFFHTYLTCWSECDFEAGTHDNLTMWRGYAGDGNGVGIVIDGAALGLDQAFQSEIVACPVFYETSEQFALRAEEAFTDFLSGLEELGDLVHRCSDHVVEAFAELCFYLAVTHKHPGFSAEKEWRFAWRKHRADVESGLSQCLRPVFVNGDVIEKFCFPIKANAHVSPSQLDIRSIIRAIMIGPCDNAFLKSNAVVSMLAAKGFQNPDSMVSISPIPYRSPR